jgi:trans-2,3-dihydro-3-hydroxyanthranilate isomerase
MSIHRFFQLDVFTSTPLGGNPLAVFPEGDGISDETMQAVAREMNLSETVFVTTPTNKAALKRLRIFTPGRELPFAGHPVVGTWNLLGMENIVAPPEGGSGTVEVVQELQLGLLPVAIRFRSGKPDEVTMTQGKFESSGAIAGAEFVSRLARGLGLEETDLDSELDIEVISTGIPTLAVPVKSLDALGRCSVNAGELIPAYKGLGAISCYVFTLETIDGGSSAAHARLFAPDDNITEDPATGSAAGSLSAYLVNKGLIEKFRSASGMHFVIEQGDFMKRPSRIHAEIEGEPGDVSQVRIGGQSVLIARGELILP